MKFVVIAMKNYLDADTQFEDLPDFRLLEDVHDRESQVRMLFKFNFKMKTQEGQA